VFLPKLRPSPWWPKITSFLGNAQIPRGQWSDPVRVQTKHFNVSVAA
jgi:hypothetical protein